MSRPKNILIVGVGGQGIILASEVLSSVALQEGYEYGVKEYGVGAAVAAGEAAK